MARVVGAVPGLLDVLLPMIPKPIAVEGRSDTVMRVGMRKPDAVLGLSIPVTEKAGVLYRL